jgi:hypothetical protein
MLCRKELPFPSQTRILSQANDVIPTTSSGAHRSQARAEIVRLMMLRRERMGRHQNAASA